MPLTILDCKGIPALRRERIEAAVVVGARHRVDLYEGWMPAIHSAAIFA